MGRTPLVMPEITPENEEAYDRFLLGLLVHPVRGHGWYDMLWPVCLVLGHVWEPFIEGSSRCARCHAGRMPPLPLSVDAEDRSVKGRTL